MSTTFEILNADDHTAARRGRLYTRRGTVETPAFMPVGTQAAVKTLTPEEVQATGSEIILANTYHLLLRPGLEIIQAAGSIHEFMGWSGPILTDSGGFQVFSLAGARKVRERGVEFRSHIDGQKIELSPERAIDLQIGYGSDVIMPLDELVAYETPDSKQNQAAERTQRWLVRSVEQFDRLTSSNADPRPLLFGITQGGFCAQRRTEHARRTAQTVVDGYSIGGLSVGESKAEMKEMLAASIRGLTQSSPRYLMGVGSPEDMWRAAAQGADMFDCVQATRVGRRGAMFTNRGRVNITNARYRSLFEPVDPLCNCYSCRTFSAAYIHHLFKSGEMLGPRLGTIHNVHFLQTEMWRMRDAIEKGTFYATLNAFLDEYRPVDESVARHQRAVWSTRRPSNAGE